MPAETLCAAAFAVFAEDVLAFELVFPDVPGTAAPAPEEILAETLATDAPVLAFAFPATEAVVLDTAAPTPAVLLTGIRGVGAPALPGILPITLDGDVCAFETLVAGVTGFDKVAPSI
ncbi:MAG: hypothetical protein VB034_09515 [Eubacteriales bacterium]|nr:hypothetical protein [Eubacteriales bacterium]